MISYIYFKKIVNVFVSDKCIENYLIKLFSKNYLKKNKKYVIYKYHTKINQLYKIYKDNEYNIYRYIANKYNNYYIVTIDIEIYVDFINVVVNTDDYFLRYIL